MVIACDKCGKQTRDDDVEYVQLYTFCDVCFDELQDVIDKWIRGKYD